MSDKACVFDCGNEASMCTPCVSAGNDTLKRDLARRQARIDAALELVDDHCGLVAARIIRAALTGADE